MGNLKHAVPLVFRVEVWLNFIYDELTLLRFLLFEERGLLGAVKKIEQVDFAEASAIVRTTKTHTNENIVAQTRCVKVVTRRRN